jgi:hypothetical protein
MSDVRMCEQRCGDPATVYAGGRGANDWAGHYCDACAGKLKFPVWYRLERQETPKKKPLPFKRVRAGYYEHEDGRYVTYRYISESIPRETWWNICYYDEDGFLVSTGYCEPTLRDAMAEIERLIGRDEDGRPQEQLYR